MGSPHNLATSVQHSHTFDTSSSTDNDTVTTQLVIEYIILRQKVIWKLCGSIGHKYDACIIRGPNFLPTSPRINM